MPNAHRGETANLSEGRFKKAGVNSRFLPSPSCLMNYNINTSLNAPLMESQAYQGMSTMNTVPVVPVVPVQETTEIPTAIPVAAPVESVPAPMPAPVAASPSSPLNYLTQCAHSYEK